MTSAVLHELCDLTMLRTKISKILHKQQRENVLPSAASDYLQRTSDCQQHFSIINYINSVMLLRVHESLCYLITKTNSSLTYFKTDIGEGHGRCPYLLQ